MLRGQHLAVVHVYSREASHRVTDGFQRHLRSLKVAKLPPFGHAVQRIARVEISIEYPAFSRIRHVLLAIPRIELQMRQTCTRIHALDVRMYRVGTIFYFGNVSSFLLSRLHVSHVSFNNRLRWNGIFGVAGTTRAAHDSGGTGTGRCDTLG